MPLLILVAMVVFAPGLVFLLIGLGHAALGSITPFACVVVLLAYLTFAKSHWFLTTQPAHIVIPGVLAWGATIFLTILWGGGAFGPAYHGHTASIQPQLPRPLCTEIPTSDPLAGLSPEWRQYLTGCKL